MPVGPETILELAENANAYTPLGAQDERIFDERYVLWMGRGDHPSWNVAQRFRFRAGELDEVRAEIHAQLRSRGRTGCSWEVGTHATPPDLVERLHALGLVDDEPDAHAIGMVLTDPPAPPPAGIEVRRASSHDDLLATARIAAAGFGSQTAIEADSPSAGNDIYLALVDGRPAARGTASFSEYGVTLFGGATLPEFRGRGAYRAVVAARWEEAVRRGTPVLVTQAGRMSRPILARLGFREVCELRILVDAFGAQEPQSAAAETSNITPPSVWK